MVEQAKVLAKYAQNLWVMGVPTLLQRLGVKGWTVPLFPFVAGTVS